MYTIYPFKKKDNYFNYDNNNSIITHYTPPLLSAQASPGY